MPPLRDGDRYVPRPRKVGPFTLDGPTWSKKGWNIGVRGEVGPGSYESVEAALLACGAVLHDQDYAWGVIHDLREKVNWGPVERPITVEDLVQYMPREEAELPTQSEIDALDTHELDHYERKVIIALGLIQESRRKR